MAKHHPVTLQSNLLSFHLIYFHYLFYCQKSPYTYKNFMYKGILDLEYTTYLKFLLSLNFVWEREFLKGTK